MRYNPKARLDSSQVSNRRGGGGGGGLGGGFPMGGGGGGGLKVGGGIGGVIVLVIVFLLTSNLGGGSDPGTPSSTAGSGTSLDQCRTGQDANQDQDCALVADVNSVQAYWRDSAAASSRAWTTRSPGPTSSPAASRPAAAAPPPTSARSTARSTSTSTWTPRSSRTCSRASSEPRAVRSPRRTCWRTSTATTSRTCSARWARSAPSRARNSDSVRLELQADCYAGMWTKCATTAEDAGGEPYILDLTQDDINRALDAAAAVGDDRIQQRSSGRVDPDSWTHGSARAADALVHHRAAAGHARRPATPSRPPRCRRSGRQADRSTPAGPVLPRLPW